MQRIVRAADGCVARLGRREEPPIFGHDIAGRKVQQRRGVAVGPRLEPALIEIVISDRSADDAEGMKVFLVALMPADKLDAQLVSGLGGTNELLLIDAEPLNQPDKRRHGGFPDGDRADLFGFDQLDLAQPAFEVMAKHGCRQPPRGAAADDDDFGYGPHYQFRFSTSTPGASWVRTVL